MSVRIGNCKWAKELGIVHEDGNWKLYMSGESSGPGGPLLSPLMYNC